MLLREFIEVRRARREFSCLNCGGHVTLGEEYCTADCEQTVEAYEFII